MIMKQHRGVTLVEMVIVLAILGILFAIAAPAMMRAHHHNINKDRDGCTRTQASPGMIERFE